MKILFIPVFVKPFLFQIIHEKLPYQLGYLVWLHRNGLPPGKIGMLLAAIYEIKLNGLEYLLKPLKKE